MPDVLLGFVGLGGSGLFVRGESGGRLGELMSRWGRRNGCGGMKMIV